MRIAAFLLLLQMSGQAQMPPDFIDDLQLVRVRCQMGVCVRIPLDFDESSNRGNGGMDAPTDKYHYLLQEFNEAAQRAADETDGKPRQNMPPLPPSGSMQCWNDSQTSDYLCQDSKGRTVDVTKAMLRLMEPADVPAVREELESVCWFHRDQPMECTNNGELDWSPVLNGTLIAEDERVRGKNGHIFTCADNSRVLLTSEDGKKWCHKVQP